MGIQERKQREKEERRRIIISAAEQVFFSKGIQAATVDDVSEAAELSKGTLYLYFKNKEELIAAVFLRGMTILQKMMEEASLQSKKALEKISTLGKVYLDFSKQYPNHFSLLFEKEMYRFETDETTPEAESCLKAGLQSLNILKEIIIEGIEEGSIRSDIDPAELALIIWGEIHGVIAIASREENCSHFQQFCTFNLQSIVTATINTIINGISAKK